MLILTETEIKKQQRLLRKTCESRMIAYLQSGKNVFMAFFPKAKIKPENQEPVQRYQAEEVFDYKIGHLVKWIRKILDEAIAICDGKIFDDEQYDSVTMPSEMSRELVATILKLFTYGRDLNDNDYYFISEVSTALGMQPIMVHKVIEQARYEVRRDFFEMLLDYLDEDQCYQCATLLVKAIRADDQIHPAEFKYIENVIQLLKNDQSKLEMVEKNCRDLESLPKVHLNTELSSYMFKYLTEIVMCDGEYDARESQFIQQVADLFGFSKEDQDNIIQPVASAMMVKSSLFPKL